MPRTVPIPALVLALLAPAAGCSWRHVTATCSHVPNPVLLGPIDRVGGHRAAPGPAVGRVDAEVVQDFTSSSHREGNLDVTTNTEHREGANKISFAVVSVTGGQVGQDVRLDDVHAGNYVFIPLAAVKNKSWAGVSGDAVKVQP